MELRQLEYVLAVIDHGGFTRAAAAVHVAQPTLSQGIRALEHELGVELFERVGRGVRLSPAGQAFAPPARRAILEAGSARLAATEVMGLRAGRLTVIALPTLVVEPLVRWIGRFHATYPRITLHVVEAEDADEVPTSVREGRADVGLAEVAGDLPALTAETVIEQELVAICPPGTRLPASVSLDRLVTMPLVVTPEGTSTRRLVESAFSGLGRAPRVAVEVSQREAILPLVLVGAGIAFVPRRIADQAHAAGATVARTRPTLRRRVGLVRRERTSNPVVAAFIAVVRADEGGGATG